MKKSLSIYATLVTIVLTSIQVCLAQTPDLTQFYKPSNLGTEFYFTVPPCHEVGGSSAINLYIACPVKTKVVVEVEGRGFISSRQTVANDIIEVKLGPAVAQAFSKTDQEGIPAEKIWEGAAIHIKAGAPIVVYCSIRFPYTSDTFLALPVEALGKEYIVASMADMTWMYGGYSLPSITTITAIEDNTTAVFTLGGNAVTKTSGGMISGQSKTLKMQRGDVFVIGNSKESKEGDMSGSKIIADKPIAVVSGNQCANVPTTLRWCDYIAEMELPTNTWGKTLLVPRVWTRKNSGMIKIFAKEPNTQIFKNGTPTSVIKKAGGVEGTGFLYERVNANGNTVAVLSANSPISATFFNPGQEDDNVVSDPFQMGIYSVEQFNKSSIIVTPGIKGGFKFDENYINIIYELTDNGTMPEDLEFGTSVNGVVKWQKLRNVFGPSIGDVFATKVNGKQYASKQCILPGDNVYMVRCNTPFGLYSYGFSNYDSYGQPGALMAYDLTKTGDSLYPIPSIVATSQGVISGSVTDAPSDSVTRSNLSKIQLGFNSKNCTLTHDNIKSGNVATAAWQVQQTDTTQAANATITFTDRAGNDTTITLSFSSKVIRPVITSSKTSYCEGVPITLSVSGGSYTSYKWSTGENTQQITLTNPALGSHTYSVTVYNQSGDSSVSELLTFTVSPNPKKPTIVRTGNTLSIDTVAGATYQWYYRGNLLVGGATKPTFVVPIDGESWSIEVTLNTCTTKSGAISVLSLVGVEDETSNANVAVSPNPVTSSVTLQYNSLQSTIVRVVSLTGTELLYVNIPETGNIKRTLDVSDLPQGTYLVKITSGLQEIVKKIVKE